MKETASLETRGEIVIPGEDLGEKKKGDSTYLDGSNVRSSVLGVSEKKNDRASVIPLAGGYMPKEGDMVVGVVSRVIHNGWLIDIHCPYLVLLSAEQDRRGRDGRNRGYNDRRETPVDPSTIYMEGDLLSVKIISVDEIKDSKGTGPRKLTGGRILRANPKKIPRIIGNKKSMLNILRDKTGCRIVVGQNGIIWVDGDIDMTYVVEEAIAKIDAESHTKGLTDRISDFLDDKVKQINKKEEKEKK
jgi:exosome complex component RRP4